MEISTERVAVVPFFLAQKGMEANRIRVADVPRETPATALSDIN